MPLTGDQLVRLAILKDEIDHAADRAVDGHLEACQPSRIEDRQQRLDHPGLRVIVDPRAG
jgi:hypothetical protein